MPRFYFDHNATTPVSPEVLEDLVPALVEVYGNPSSIHRDGQLARQRLESARRGIAGLMRCDPREIIFLSGGTEAANLAILGTVRFNGASQSHVITTTIEHPCVLNACAQLRREGAEITYVPVGSRGIVDPADIRAAIRPGTALISVMHVNNELGSIQPLEEIAAVAREAGIPLHSDGVQAFGKLPVEMPRIGAALYSISGHKFQAPKGVGVLYARQGTKLAPLLWGGRHERDRRAGTENVPGAIALARAAAEAVRDLPQETARLSALRDRLETTILDRVPASGVNGACTSRVANTTNLYFDAIEGEAVVISLDLQGFAVSSGSACSSGAVEPSHVLLAIGASPERARSSVRFSLGRANNEEQVDALADAVAASVARLRKLSPVYAGA